MVEQRVVSQVLSLLFVVKFPDSQSVLPNLLMLCAVHMLVVLSVLPSLQIMLGLRVTPTSVFPLQAPKVVRIALGLPMKLIMKIPLPFEYASPMCEQARMTLTVPLRGPLMQRVMSPPRLKLARNPPVMTRSSCLGWLNVSLIMFLLVGPTPVLAHLQLCLTRVNGPLLRHLLLGRMYPLFSIPREKVMRGLLGIPKCSPGLIPVGLRLGWDPRHVLTVHPQCIILG